MAIFNQKTLPKTVRQVCDTNCLYLATCNKTETHIKLILISLATFAVDPSLKKGFFIFCCISLSLLQNHK